MNWADMRLGDVAALGFFSIWLALSIPHQFDSGLGRWVRRLNFGGLVPIWTFFAPKPGTSDYHIIIRDGSSGCPGEWVELEWCHQRRILDAIWHPDRQRTKVIVDCINGIAMQLKEMRATRSMRSEAVTEGILSAPYLAISAPYLVLLNVVMSAPLQCANATARQFAILEVKPGQVSDRPKVILCSPAHDLT